MSVLGRILCLFHLCNTAKIQHIPSQADAEKLEYAVATSRLDYCNSLLFRSPSKSIKTLNLVQNTGTCIMPRISTGHISPL